MISVANIKALEPLLRAERDSIETKLRRVIAGIPLTKGLADGMKIRKQLRDIIFTIRSRDEPLNTQRIKNYQKQNGEIKMTLKNNKQGGEK